MTMQMHLVHAVFGVYDMQLVWQVLTRNHLERELVFHCVKVNLGGALVRQSIGLHLSDFLRLFTMHTISELSTFNHSQIFCYKIVILFICCYNGNTRLNRVKPRLTLLILDLLKFQSYFLSTWFHGCFPLHADRHFCNLHPRARTICRTNNTSRSITGYSNRNASAQFPKAIPYLVISDHKWFSVSRTFLLQVCHYRATFNYTPKS